jgi:hypothetical protein
MDCEAALKLQPKYLKAIRRAAKCCFNMKRFDECVAWCYRGLEESDGKDKELLELRNKAAAEKVGYNSYKICY